MDTENLKDKLASELQRALEEQGFLSLTDVQTQTLPPALEGHNISVCAKTGSGKTAAFCLPILDRLQRQPKATGSTRALILVPTRELALQIQANLTEFAKYTLIKSGLVIGGEAYKHQVATIRRNPEILIATPGRLVEHIKNGNTDFKDLEFVVLDEADRMLEMGFHEDMEHILRVSNSDAQKLFFSATLNLTKKGFIQKHNPGCVEIELDHHRQANQQIKQFQILADDLNHKKKLVAHLCQAAPGKVMVFCKTRAQSQALSNFLQSQKVKSAYIHGELAQNDRKQILNRFRQGHIQTLVATDVAARGLDIADVELVINYTVAQSGDEHTHRVGRTGRAEQMGRCITLVEADEWNLKASIERYLNVRFEPMTVAELKAAYKGPKKIKNSGKAVSTKKKASKNDKVNKKPTNKKRGARPASPIVVDPDGNAPLKRKPKPNSL